MNEYITSLVRHILTTVGGSLVTKGVITAVAFDQIVGAVIVIAGVVWSVVAKSVLNKLHLEQVATALLSPPPSNAPEGTTVANILSKL